MQLWECTYKVITSNGSFRVVDYIWSTGEPSQNSIGHYWSHGFQHKIEDQKCYQIDPPEGELKAHLHDFRDSDGNLVYPTAYKNS